MLDGKSDIPTRLWIAPPTKMDAMILNEEGYYGVLGKSGARMEMPGCSLCMGNQAQIRKGSTAMSTSTRNFPNRLGIDTNVYLGSAELAAVCALTGKIPSLTEYMAAPIGAPFLFVKVTECFHRREGDVSVANFYNNRVRTCFPKLSFYRSDSYIFGKLIALVSLAEQRHSNRCGPTRGDRDESV